MVIDFCLQFLQCPCFLVHPASFWSLGLKLPLPPRPWEGQTHQTSHQGKLHKTSRLVRRACVLWKTHFYYFWMSQIMSMCTYIWYTYYTKAWMDIFSRSPENPTPEDFKDLVVTPSLFARFIIEENRKNGPFGLDTHLMPYWTRCGRYCINYISNDGILGFFFIASDSFCLMAWFCFPSLSIWGSTSNQHTLFTPLFIIGWSITFTIQIYITSTLIYKKTNNK